ncbi:MAG: tetratricopeptide repeat protein [Methylomonas sp.]|nr:tetratricopeptide repeat protein [Methylomonas sp.]PPD21971.1 MAG: hypothetical protein CTY23_03935 [Methylomonas sp.]PPD25548.1 MAG: hypothetical protein CTY22_08105 [Methylomonas sp.]PPD36458.1 MAG: hypothetical protein CTY21_08105 [Methylomonas sp.]PPD39190.1 MAG: hypothetical protein CTY17_08320 [Methylomonas sp.]
MNKTTLMMLMSAVLAVSGCATAPETKPPVASVKPATTKKNVPPKAVATKPAPPTPVRKSAPGTATYAIDAPKGDFKLEPTQPVLKAEPLPTPADVPAQTTVIPGVADAIAPATPTPAPPAVALAPPVPTMTAVAVEDVPIPSGTQPAILALLTESDRNRGAGDLDAAVVSLERALRIDSRNPSLTYKLAHLRLKQNRPQLAEELASKAALLAGGDLDLKRKSWLLIAEARRLQQNLQGARDAKAKAMSFFGR